METETMEIKWTDATSYRRDQFNKIEPTAWETHVNGIPIYVSCSHSNYKPEWVVICPHLDIDPVPLGKNVTTAEQAQKEALEVCAWEAGLIMKKLTGFVDRIKKAGDNKKTALDPKAAAH